MSTEEENDSVYNDVVAAKNPEVKLEDNEVEDVKDNEYQGQDPFPVKLPRGIITTIYSYLDPASIKTVRLVSRHWKHIIETAKFWTWAELEVDRSNHQEVLETKLVHLVSGIRICRSLEKEDFLTLLDKLLTRIISSDLPQLRNFNLYGSMSHQGLGLPDLLTSLKPTLLEAVVRLENCNLEYSNLTTEQLTVLLRVIQESENIKLKTFDITWNPNLSHVEPGLIQALVRLETCSMSVCDLTTEQLTVLFRAIQESEDINLKNLCIQLIHQSFPSVEPELLKAVLKLEECYLDSCELSTEQLTLIFRAIQESEDLKLKTLNVGGIFNFPFISGGNPKISSVEPGLIQAVVRLENCKLSNVTTEQLTILFRAIQESTDLKLKTLGVAYNHNLSSVEPELLQAVVRLEDCDLPLCNLTTEQLIVLFGAIQESTDLKLKTLNVSGSFNISTMDPGLLEAVVKLENCDLEDCKMTREQLTVLFGAIQESEDLKLKTLNVSRSFNLSSVEPGLLSAVVRLENCSMNACNLTTEQLTVLLRGIQESEDIKLRELCMSSNNLSGVVPDILVEAVARLKIVHLTNTSLTTDQLTGVFILVAERRPMKWRWIDIRGNDAITYVTASLRNKAKKSRNVSTESTDSLVHFW